MGFPSGQTWRRCRTISVYELATSQVVYRFPSVPRLWGIAWNPSGDRLALTGDDFVQIRDVQTGGLVWQKKLSPVNWRFAKWNPQGTILAVRDGNNISLWDVMRDKQLSRLDLGATGEPAFAFNPAGTLLATSDWGGVLKLFDPLTGRQIFSTYATVQNPAPQFSAEGRFLAATMDAKKLNVLEVASGNEYQTLLADPLKGSRPYASVSSSTDGRLLAAGAAGEVTLWDWSTGKELAFQEGSSFNLVAFEDASPRVAGKAMPEALLVMRDSGLIRLPIVAGLEDAELRLGPTENLGVPASNAVFAQSRNGRVMVFAQGDGALVRHADQPDQLICPRQSGRQFDRARRRRRQRSRRRPLC
jgi:WD40 repeat protein